MPCAAGPWQLEVPGTNQAQSDCTTVLVTTLQHSLHRSPQSSALAARRFCKAREVSVGAIWQQREWQVIRSCSSAADPELAWPDSPVGRHNGCCQCDIGLGHSLQCSLTSGAAGSSFTSAGLTRICICCLRLASTTHQESVCPWYGTCAGRSHADERWSKGWASYVTRHAAAAAGDAVCMHRATELGEGSTGAHVLGGRGAQGVVVIDGGQVVLHGDVPVRTTVQALSSRSPEQPGLTR